MVSRLIAGSLFLLLYGCASYDVSAVSSDTRTDPAPPETAYDPAITAGDLYTVAWAETEAQQTEASCRDAQIRGTQQFFEIVHVL